MYTSYGHIKSPVLGDKSQVLGSILSQISFCNIEGTKCKIQKLANPKRNRHQSNVSHTNCLKMHKVVYRPLWLIFSKIYCPIFKFYATNLLPPHMARCYCKELCKSGLKLEWAMTREILFFLYRVAGFLPPRLYMTWLFCLFVVFQ